MRAAPVRVDIRGLLPSLAVTSIDDHPDRGVAGEVLLEIARQLRVAPRDDEQEAIRLARQSRRSALTDLVARRTISRTISHTPDPTMHL